MPDYDFHTKTFRANLSKASNPHITETERLDLLNYFLAYESKRLENSPSSVTPKEVENALKRLENPPVKISYHKTKWYSYDRNNWQNNIPLYCFIMIICTIAAGVILHKILSPSEINEGTVPKVTHIKEV
ncbi:hypothetical protein [Catenovulum agarivorans]|uniref:hypothetical protein n=1 Tax=Catenovulum agarivorans TaxID=1172192 RepID=UPI000370E5C8|nr:hypothetical protein [Catenovulum agarivorans]